MTRLLFKSGINSNNYSLDVVGGTVYAIGLAENLDEKMSFEKFLSEMKDIPKLVTIINIKNKGLIIKKISALFQMDPFSKLNLKTDTTISLIKSGVRLGIEIWIADPKDLSFKKIKSLP